VTNEPDDKAEPVSMTKKSPSAGDPAPKASAAAAGTPAGKAPAPPAGPRPRTVLYAVVAMVLSASAALIAAVVLYGQSHWLQHEQAKSNSSSVKTLVASAESSASKAGHDTASAAASASASATKKYPLGGSKLHHQVTQQQSGALIGSVILVLATAMLSFGVYRGRHWSRWAVVAFWFLASFTGTFAGVTYIFAIGGSLPAPFKVPLFVSATSLLVAVLLVNLKPSTAYFAANRPANAPARRGLFAPRVPSGGGAARGGATRGGAARGGAAPGTKGPVSKTVTSTAAGRGEAFVQKQKSKKRAAANADSVARGAELARNRAKASKSRRIEP
jgi:hypothetical protein